jgi:hypothetical protein
LFLTTQTETVRTIPDTKVRIWASITVKRFGGLLQGGMLHEAMPNQATLHNGDNNNLWHHHPLNTQSTQGEVKGWALLLDS